MKRKLFKTGAVLSLCLMLVLTLCGCSIDHQDAGYYEVSNLDCYGTTASGEDLAALGIDPASISLYLAEDGSGYVNLFGAQTELDWYDGVIVMDGSKIFYSKSDDTISMSTTEGDIEFVRVSDEPAI